MLSDWKDSIDKWPPVDFGNLYTYFVNTPGMYTTTTMQAYKSLDSYSLYHSGHVQTVFYHGVHSQSPVCILKGKVIRSQRVTETAYDVWATVEKTSGMISAAHCTCMAGLGSSCSHVAALLFKVEAAARLNLINSCTEQASVWNNSYREKVIPAEIRNMDFSCGIHPERRKSIRKGPVPKQKRKFTCQLNRVHITKPNPQTALKKLWDINDSKSATIFTAYPKSYYKHGSETDTASEDETLYPSTPALPVVLTALYRPQYLSLNDKELKDTGRRIYPILTQDSDRARGMIEEMTRDQHRSPMWHVYRAGRITASKAHDVVVRKEKTPPSKLVVSILNYESHYTNKYMQWGIDMEPIALSKYSDHVKHYHQNMSISHSGLLLSSSLPYLAASPDGIRTCSCHERCLIEIKCPYKYKDEDPNECFGNKDYCIDQNGDLKVTHRYFSQVQMQMYVSGIDMCDFVVFTEKGLFIKNITRDANFISNMTSKATLFFFNFIMPELLSRTIQKSIPVPKIKVSSVCFCEKPEAKRMLTCSDTNCSVMKFHYKCVGLTRKPKDSKWYCPVCERLSNLNL